MCSCLLVIWKRCSQTSTNERNSCRAGWNHHTCFPDQLLVLSSPAWKKSWKRAPGPKMLQIQICLKNDMLCWHRELKPCSSGEPWVLASTWRFFDPLNRPNIQIWSRPGRTPSALCASYCGVAHWTVLSGYHRVSWPVRMSVWMMSGNWPTLMPASRVSQQSAAPA